MENKSRFSIDYIPVVIALCFVGFHIVASGYQTLPGVKQMVVHLGFALVMIFSNMMVESVKKEKKLAAVIDAIMCIAAFGISIYAYTAVELAQGANAGIVTRESAIIGAVFLVLLLIATRNRVGNGLPLIVLIFLAYALFGKYLPQPYGHRGYTVSRIVGNLFLGTDAIWGSVLQASSVFIAVFIIFGSVLQIIHGGEFIAEFAQGMLGDVRGGPAKVSVIASGLFGSISGSVAANVVGTGTVTIPLMKKSGFEPEYAAAVEAIASTGGQLMPPVMGATAFILAEYCGVTYGQLMVMAIVPAILYYFHVFLQVDFYAKKKNLKPLDASEKPDIKAVMKWGGHLFIPILVIIYCLVFSNLSVSRSAFYGIVVGVLVSFFKKETRINLKALLPIIRNCAMSISMIAVACASAGMIVGVFSLTGLGFKLSNLLVTISGGHVVVLLIITMIASLILGMGLPTTAAYVVLASLVAPALIEFGIPKIVAHFFIFYFGIYANVTPPVAVGLYAAIGIAKTTKIWRTAYNALMLGLTGFLLPYVMLYRPGLRLQGGMQTILLDIIVTTFSIIVFNCGHAGMIGKHSISMITRVLLIALFIIMLGPWGNMMVDIISSACALILMVATYLMKEWKSKKQTA